jgi:hypothetical protein
MFVPGSRWLETEALLRGGHLEIAQQDIAQMEKVFMGHPRYEFLYQRSRAVLTAFQGDLVMTRQHLEAAWRLVETMNLPRERFDMKRELVRLGPDTKN